MGVKILIGDLASFLKLICLYGVYILRIFIFSMQVLLQITRQHKIIIYLNINEFENDIIYFTILQNISISTLSVKF